MNSIFPIPSDLTPLKSGVYFVDVGYGSCTVLIASDIVAVVDSGPPESSQTMVAFLRARGISRIDLLLITHSHKDHLGGAPALLELMDPDSLFMFGIDPENLKDLELQKSVRSLSNSRSITMRIPAKGETIRLSDSMALELLGPSEVVSTDPNDNSVVALVTIEKLKVLLPGDLGPIAQITLASEFGGSLKTDVLLAPHHGLYVADELVSAVRPVLSVISVGPNEYGAPDDDSIRLLCSRSKTVKRTDLDGDVFVPVANPT